MTYQNTYSMHIKEVMMKKVIQKLSGQSIKVAVFTDVEFDIYFTLT